MASTASRRASTRAPRQRKPETPQEYQVTPVWDEMVRDRGNILADRGSTLSRLTEKTETGGADK